MKSELKDLLSLLDDDSKEIRNQVISKLKIYGPSLELDIENFSNLMNTKKWELLIPILEKKRKYWLECKWQNWITENSAENRLENALDYISKYFNGLAAKSYSISLDKLAKEFNSKYPYGDEIDLAKYLFQEKGFRGNKKNYYDFRNSDLIWVLNERKGIPISLCIIYILVGRRLGLYIEGCNFPGHFLAKIFLDTEFVLIDCFDEGKLIYEYELQANENVYDSVRYLIHESLDDDTIIRRVLNNMINSFEENNDSERKDLFESLLRMMNV